MATDPREFPESSVSASSSQEGDGDRQRGRELKRTKSMLLRNFVVEADIKSTTELVKAYNRTTEEKDRDALHEWLEQYVKWFCDRKDAHVAEGAINEYISLVRVDAREPKDKKLVKDVLASLITRAERETVGTGYSTSALCSALQVIDADVFVGDSAILFGTASVLLAKLDPSNTAFIRETSTYHETTLLALHQTLLLIHHVAPNRLNPDEKGFYQNTKKRLDEVSEQSDHFPITFQVETAKQSLLRLARKESMDVMPALKRCIKGLLYLSSGVRHAIVADCDMESLEKG